MSIDPPPITAELYHYLVDASLRENELLATLRKETLRLPGGKMISAPEQAQFIALLIRLMSATRVIEIGTFTGYATLAMALALPPEGRIVTCDVQAEPAELGEKYWQQAGVAHKIERLIGPALASLDNLRLAVETEKFDLAFIDADKKSNQAYFEKLRTLVRPGGLIIIDNVLWHGKVISAETADANTNAIRAFNEFIKNDCSVDISIIPLGDGLTLARL